MTRRASAVGRFRVRAGLALLAVVLAGCTSSTGKPSKPVGDTTTPPASSTPAPTTSAPSPPPSTTTSSAKPLSPFEADPAVQVLRRWMAESAKAVNSGHYTSVALRALMTRAVAAQMKAIEGGDVGLYYPGPVPFRPLRVSVPSADTRRVDACVVSTGFAEKPGTHRPAKRLSVVAGTFVVTKRGGKWLVSALRPSASISCRRAKVPMPRW